MLHVIVLFERFHEAQHLGGLGAGQLDVILRHHADFGGGRRDARLGQGLFYRFEGFGRGTMYHAEPSSFISSAPASKTRSSNFSSEAASFGMVISPLRWNIQPTAPASAMFPPFLVIKWRNSPTMRFRFVVTTWISKPTPPGP